VILLPFESRLEVRECPDLPPGLVLKASTPDMLDLLTCPLLVLFAAMIGSRECPEPVGLPPSRVEGRSPSASALTVLETVINVALPTKAFFSWLENPEDDVGGVSSLSLVSAWFCVVSVDRVGDLG
jgi:hypothetical protein